MWQFIPIILFGICSVVNAKSLQSRIVNGNDAEVGQFPWMVSVRFAATSEPKCGGALLTPEHVITAALCLLAPMQNVTALEPSELFVVTGHVNNFKGGRNTGVSDIRVHPGFDLSLGFQNNIGILKLRTPIPFNALELPIPLPTNAPGVHQCVLSGWGTTNFPSAVMPTELQTVILHSMTIETCLKSWSSAMVFNSVLCARNAESSGVICINDFGSPLICNKELTGIVSWGDFCATSRPDLFTEVFYFRDWIINNTADLTV